MPLKAEKNEPPSMGFRAAYRPLGFIADRTASHDWGAKVMTWDLTSYFPQFDGLEMRRFRESLLGDISCLKQEASALPSLTNESAASWEEILLRNEDIARRMSHLGSYITCLASSDARNEQYLKQEAELVRL